MSATGSPGIRRTRTTWPGSAPSCPRPRPRPRPRQASRNGRWRDHRAVGEPRPGRRGRGPPARGTGLRTGQADRREGAEAGEYRARRGAEDRLGQAVRPAAARRPRASRTAASIILASSSPIRIRQAPDRTPSRMYGRRLTRADRRLVPEVGVACTSIWRRSSAHASCASAPARTRSARTPRGISSSSWESVRCSGPRQATGAQAVDDDVRAHVPRHHDGHPTWGALTRRSSMRRSGEAPHCELDRAVGGLRHAWGQ